jgi:mono/diheme cytochrome c family protein
MFCLLLDASGWALFIGRFHPLLVHLPIGFLLIAAFLEVGRRTNRIQVSLASIAFILLWSAIGATLACVAGYLLSLGGGYDAVLLDRHKWQGIGVACFAWIAWVVSFEKLRKKIPLSSTVYMCTFGLAVLLTMTAGHDGGSLTHGEGYLTQYTPEPFRTLAGMPPIEAAHEEIKPIADIEQAIVYQDIVQPIMKTNCIQCHNASKSKGDLRLDQLDLIKKGGESGPALQAGNSATSDLIKRCLLPENDDKHMPPKGKPQLTNEQIALLSWWIEQGAPGDKKVADLQKSDAVKLALTSLTSGNVAEKATPSPVLSMEVEPADQKKVDALQKAGLLVNPISQDKNLLEVSAVNAKAFDDRQIALLTELSDQIVTLKLSGTKVTDASMKEIGKLKYLTKLYLDRTAVTDAGLAALKSLKYLQYVNLIGTKVTNNGLINLAAIKTIRSIYVWNSNVTNEIVEKLAKTNPHVVIINGFRETSIVQSEKHTIEDLNENREIQ